MSHAKPPQRFRSSFSWWTKWDCCYIWKQWWNIL